MDFWKYKVKGKDFNWKSPNCNQFCPKTSHVLVENSLPVSVVTKAGAGETAPPRQRPSRPVLRLTEGLEVTSDVTADLREPL